MKAIKRFIKADSGRCSHVIKYETGKRVEIPINSEGSVRWYEDRMKATIHCADARSAPAMSN